MPPDAMLVERVLGRAEPPSACAFLNPACRLAVGRSKSRYSPHVADHRQSQTPRRGTRHVIRPPTLPPSALGLSARPVPHRRFSDAQLFDEVNLHSVLTSAHVSTGLDFLFEREETWCCPVHDFGRAKAKITLQPDYGRLVRWWQRCRAGDRRHCDSQERHAFGGGRFPICFGAGQDCELPDPGVADMGARYAPWRSIVVAKRGRPRQRHVDILSIAAEDTNTVPAPKKTAKTKRSGAAKAG